MKPTGANSLSGSNFNGLFVQRSTVVNVVQIINFYGNNIQSKFSIKPTSSPSGTEKDGEGRS